MSPSTTHSISVLDTIINQHLISQGGLDIHAGPACAQGHFVHVFVDRNTRTSVPIPDALRNAMTRLVPVMNAGPQPA